MNILITGANGFIGKALYTRLANTHGVKTLVSLSRSLPNANHHNKTDDKVLRFISGDITDVDLVRNTISEYEITHVYHMAAQAIVRKAAQDPVSAYMTNVMGTVNLLEAIRTVGMPHIKSIVVSTSDKAYGHSPAPYNEDTPFRPQYTYEATKACQDIVASNYFHNYGLPVKIARCSNIYGPDDPNRSRLIPNTIARILKGQAPQIYTSVAEYVREWVYVDDVVNAFTLISTKGKPGEAYCVGGTKTASVKEVVDTLLKLCKSDLKTEYLDKAAQFKEIQEQYIDGTKIKALGWNPEYDLEQGLTNTVEYYENNNR